jgi:ABC-type multidrug transport system fused ATPase/permease subunit
MQGILERFRSKRVTILDRIYRESNERFTGFVSEMVKGSTDVKILNSGEAFKAELAARITTANDNRLHMQGRSWVYRLTRMEIGAVAYLGFMALLAYLISTGGITSVTAIILFNYYSQLDTSAIAALSEFLEFVRDFNLSAERVYEILQGNHFSKEHFGDTEIADVKGEVELSHVYFAYKSSDPTAASRDVLKDMNMLIPAGTTVAFVGLSGSGKSTTINLISKLYETNKGQVKIDGIDIRRLSKETIRSNISVVSQKPYIFNISVRDNLRLVKPDMTEDEMIAACKKACIHDDILQMEDGYDTIVGEGGTNMSGGQCQRLAIARTLLRDYKILMLDEATSALDNITQARIQEVLRNLHGEKTVIIIAHRLSTTINADIIFFIDDGRVLASGTHDELLKKCDKYRMLCEGDCL